MKRSIDRIKAFEPPDGYFLGFSGGKDSVVIKALSDMAGVKYDAHYNITTVDPIELVHFIRDEYPDVIWDRPKYSMRQLIIKAMIPPSRHNRYCCSFLKEVNGGGRVVMTGSRWAESLNRYKSQGVVTIFNAKKGSRVANDLGAEYDVTQRGGIIMNMDNDPARRTVEQCYRTNKTLINPIVDWTDEDVWEFIHAENISYCSLYDEGWTRLGCIGCPLANYRQRVLQFQRWPNMYRVYLNAFDDMLKARAAAGKDTDLWDSAEDVMDLWLNEWPRDKPIEDQLTLGEIC